MEEERIKEKQYNEPRRIKKGGREVFFLFPACTNFIAALQEAVFLVSRRGIVDPTPKGELHVEIVMFVASIHVRRTEHTTRAMDGIVIK